MSVAFHNLLRGGMFLLAWLKSRLHEPNNAGSEQDRRAALDSVAQWTNVIIGLSTGSVMLSATFLGRLYQGEAFWILVSSWGLFGLSIFSGVLVMGQRIAQLAESDLRVRGGPLEYLALLQWGSFVAAVVLFLIFALQNVPAGPEGCSGTLSGGQ